MILKPKIKIAGIEGSPHENSLKNGDYEAYVYHDSIHITKAGVLVCRIRNGRIDCGGVDVHAIRGPSDEFFACVWVYDRICNHLVDFFSCFTVEGDDPTKEESFQNILNELINECKEEML